MIKIKTPEDIEKMADAAKIASGALKMGVEAVGVGVTTLEIDSIVDKYISDHGAEAGFKKVEGYNNATCVNVNDGLVHGIPSDYKLRKGDLVSIDLGVFLDGWNSDLAYSLEVETNEHGGFLDVGKTALTAGINSFILGNTLGDIGNSIQSVIEDGGYSVSRDLVGHGVGRELHEDPQVLGYGVSYKGTKLKEGMVFAIEVIYQMGGYEIAEVDDDNDSWTLVTRDGSISGLFEHTVALTKDGPKVLTEINF